jgi:hypothetical protein
VRWEPIDDTSARAALTDDSTAVELTFQFDPTLNGNNQLLVFPDTKRRETEILESIMECDELTEPGEIPQYDDDSMDDDE